jgi:hypothetical protein
MLGDFELIIPIRGGVRTGDVGLSGYTGTNPIIVIPEGITYISNSPFAVNGNDFITSIHIPSSVTWFSHYDTFRGMKVLRTVTFEPGLTMILERAFADCPMLDDVVLPGTLIRLGANAFENCTNLKRIVVPPSVTRLQEQVVRGVGIDATSDPTKDIFRNTHPDLTIFGAAGSAIETYARAKGINFVAIEFDENNNIKSSAVSVSESVTIEIFIDNTTARVNGTNVTLDQSATLLNGRTVVPARFIAENLGANVAWDDLARKVTITRDNTIIEIVIDNTTARVNGANVTLDQSATLLNGRTVVPARFIAENLGATVEWDDLARKVTIKR